MRPLMKHLPVLLLFALLAEQVASAQPAIPKDRIPADVVLDMVYNPAETLLLRQAREQGKTVIAGLEMFIEQAVRQFEVWTGESAPRAVMERVAREALGQK